MFRFNRSRTGITVDYQKTAVAALQEFTYRNPVVEIEQLTDFVENHDEWENNEDVMFVAHALHEDDIEEIRSRLDKEINRLLASCVKSGAIFKIGAGWYWCKAWRLRVEIATDKDLYATSSPSFKEFLQGELDRLQREMEVAEAELARFQVTRKPKKARVSAEQA